MKRSIIILAVIAAAVLVPVALAKPTPYSSTQFYTPEALNAWGMRAQAEAQYYLTQGPSAGADDRIVEDEGMPLPFERPYWAGEFPLDRAADNLLALPFSPSSLLHAAHREWLGFDLEPGGLDVPVHGFATDGRREVRQHTPLAGPALHVVGMPSRAELHAAARRAAGAGPDPDADSDRGAAGSSPSCATTAATAAPTRAPRAAATAPDRFGRSVLTVLRTEPCFLDRRAECDLEISEDSPQNGHLAQRVGRLRAGLGTEVQRDVTAAVRDVQVRADVGP